MPNAPSMSGTASRAETPPSAVEPKRALIIIAHGSRRGEANDEFFALVKRVSNQRCGYDVVVPALLEQAPPTLLQACQSLANSIEQVDVYPLFFNRGRHIERDIPAQVAEIMEAFPERQVRLLEYFGQSDALPSLMVQHILTQA